MRTARACSSHSSAFWDQTSHHIPSLALSLLVPSLQKLELSENKNTSGDREAYDKCVAILRGEPGTARYALDEISSPEAQASLLLEMGKDVNILGRTWVGWGPWI